jgi:hypothetical protein
VLDPDSTSGLARYDILVEIHDAQSGTIENILESRFTATHSIRRVVATSHTHNDPPPRPRRRLSEGRERELRNEGRSRGLRWLFI